ncbi:MAG: hypothetical protein ABIJ20_03095 [Nanoarchaeota archaeon]|nr:hypothetical protein [Nanoarchaeota archaeon]MBU1444715.1 hypothetical protein [Nanoarchaeota archaeon]MBU2406576.1 hypothetical protein [Nanoarchaeota archaeon]MBU2420567.1 hypothetical protein [Nanoarchaeota archaeon]MBU2475790.1 hypothetical protein [Nanoarchaeota archaeon]
MKKIFLFIICFFVMFSLVQAGALTSDCSIKLNCLPGELSVFFVSNNGGNAHASPPNGISYSYEVCCPHTGLDRIDDTNRAVILSFTDWENAHVYGPAGPDQSDFAYLHDQTNEVVNCDTTFDGQVGEYCVASISSLINAHVGNCTGVGSYPIKVYCNVAGGGLPCELFDPQWCNSTFPSGCNPLGLTVNESDLVYLRASGLNCDGLDAEFNVYENDGGPDDFIESVGINTTLSNLVYLEWIVPYIPGNDVSGSQLQYQFKVNETISGGFNFSQLLLVNPICAPLSTCWDNSDCPPDSCYTNIWCDKSTPTVAPFCECAMSGYICGGSSPYGADIIIRIRSATDCIDDGDGDNIGTYNITLQYFNTSATPPDFIGNQWTESSKQCFLDKEVPFYGLFSLILTIFFIGIYYKRKSFKKN